MGCWVGEESAWAGVRAWGRAMGVMTWKLEVGSWKFGGGSRPSEVGSWKLGGGSLDLGVGRWGSRFENRMTQEDLTLGVQPRELGSVLSVRCQVLSIGRGR